MKGIRTKLDMVGALALPFGIALVLQGSVLPADAAAPAARAPAAVSFATDVKPIIDARCVTCHGGVYEGEKRTELSFDMTTYEGLMAGSEYGSVIEVGDPDESLLVEMIEMGDMPEEGDPLTPEQIEIIRTWIAEGAQNN